MKYGRGSASVHWAVPASALAFVAAITTVAAAAMSAAALTTWVFLLAVACVWLVRVARPALLSPVIIVLAILLSVAVLGYKFYPAVADEPSGGGIYLSLGQDPPAAV